MTFERQIFFDTSAWIRNKHLIKGLKSLNYTEDKTFAFGAGGTIKHGDTFYTFINLDEAKTELTLEEAFYYRKNSLKRLYVSLFNQKKITIDNLLEYIENIDRLEPVDIGL